MPAVSPPKHRTGPATWVTVIVTLVVVLLTGTGTVVTLYYTGYLGGDLASTGVAPNAGAAEDPPSETGKPPLYLPLEPPLVVNFDRQGRVGYLQAGLQLMARQQSVIDTVERNMPIIRNNLLMLLSSQSYETLSSRDGKERLRQKTLDEINSVLDQVGAPGRVEAVYFTAFVMQ